MTVVNGTIAAPDGSHPRATVAITLVDQAGRAVAGFDSGADVEVLGGVVAAVAADGTWSADLTPNADVTSPTGTTLYRVTERVEPGGPAVAYHISVPASGTHWVGDLRVTLPGEADAEITGYLPLTGGTMTGPLVLDDGSPAASEQYVADHAGEGGGGGTPSGTVMAETSYGQAAAAGSSSAYSRGDHTHGTPALPTPGAIGAATSGHTHSGVYDPAGTATAALSAHEGAADPHPDYLTSSDGDAAYAALAHQHAGGDIASGTVAVARLPVGTSSSTVAAGDHTHSGVYDPAGTASSAVAAHAAAADPHGDRAYADAGDNLLLAKADNLADVASASDARTNLGLGGAATRNVGTSAGTVAAGDDARITGAVQATIADAKGDLIAASAADTVTRLAVGSNGQALVANSSATAGLSYVAPSAFQVSPLSHYGLLAASGDPMDFLVNSPIANGQIFLVRVWIPAGAAITSLWVAIRSGGTHDGSTTPNQLALYTDAGVQVDTTPNDNSLFTASGWRGGALSGGPVAAQSTGRWVYIGHIARGMTGGSTAFPSGVDDNQAPWFTRGPAGGNRRSMYQTGQTALPSSFDPTSHGTPTTFMPLYGVT